MSGKPKVFIASSKEGKLWALAVKQNLEQLEVAQGKPWFNAFEPGRNTIDELRRILLESDFGVFVLSPDDVSKIRGQAQKVARDNVILELGMFIGRLGKERSFILKPKTDAVRLPTDLLGVVTEAYEDKGEDDDYANACLSACGRIAALIGKQSNTRFEVDPAVKAGVEAICHAMSVPVDPEKSSLRVFIFRKEGSELVCTYFHHSDPKAPDERAEYTRVTISEACAKKIVVVNCFLENIAQGKKFKATGARVRPLDKPSACVQGDIKRNLTYVLAAPIRDEKGNAWGVVDFDASNEIGTRLLEQPASHDATRRLAKYLSLVLTKTS